MTPRPCANMSAKTNIFSPNRFTTSAPTTPFFSTKGWKKSVGRPKPACPEPEKGKNIFKRRHHDHRRGSQPCAKIQSRRRSGRQSDRRRAFRPRTSLPGRRFPRSAAVCPLHFLNFQHGRQLPVRIRPNGPIPLSFYEKDLKTGRLTRETAAELLAEFFISLNKDTDLYRGVQQGDNGQSLMLGGCKPEDGSSAVNDLTYLIMEVSKELKLIDPKINLRIDSHTPDDLLELGCELTKCGLGFPQYSNDEVVIPALVKKVTPSKTPATIPLPPAGNLSFPAKVSKLLIRAPFQCLTPSMTLLKRPWPPAVRSARKNSSR